ncbi:Complement C1s subcomponent [Varanus komodoensis]|uniref:Complement C1s n=1 Tax=Varanus komodoensis TaxID=61221 RepID=A0A8D2IQZ9_VARKO|nr:complement C1s subcomponent [Varanus komodoensis]XP_044305615.1 complement C1s subcomponent [Varanus komodoensis]KAF7238162.1 Complement C1s subcomponent [Varanus komodoensis]
MELLQRWYVITCFLLAHAEATTMYGEILSPNYPQAYPNDALESWKINVPPGYGIHLYFTHLDIEPSQNCEYDFVKILSGNQVEGQLCGQKSSQIPGTAILEEFHFPYNSLTITFQSDFSNEERFTGFAAYYVAQDMNECIDFAEEPCSHYCNNYIGGYFCSCPPEYFLQEDQKTCSVNCSGNVFTELSGEIASPNYPGLYPENSNCDYRIALESGYRVVLTIGKDFSIEAPDMDGNCVDSLTFTAGDQRFGPYCGSVFTGPPEIKTTSNIVDILFQTDQTMQDRGWKIRYSAEPIPCPQEVTPNSVLDPVRDHYVVKDTVMVTCVEGHEIVLPHGSLRSFYASCQSNGKWSSSDQRCVPVDCGMPDELRNGDVTFLSGSEATMYEATIRYSCKHPYYTLKDEGDGVYRCSASGKWVDKDEKTDLPVCIPVCGLSQARTEIGRIFGGRIADEGEVPWQIYFEQPRGGGALISDRWILTAAHVLDGNPSPTIYAGRHMVGKNVLRTVKPLDVEGSFIHPNWAKVVTDTRTNFDNDIALLKLREPLTMGPTISPICLPGPSPEYDPAQGTIGFVAGWGRTEVSKASVKLRLANIPVMGMEMCERVKPDPPADSLSYVFTENMICAGNGQQDSCKGDSGGAYAIQDPNNESRYYVAGLVSWGPKCGTYGLYTKVANYVDWITGVINRHEDSED